MQQPQSARRPEALATGLLASKPLAHLLVYALERKLTGTFELVETTRERMHVSVQNGLVSRVASSETLVYLGHVLYESGVLDGAQLGASLAEVASTRQLHGQILLATGTISPQELAEGLRQQRARKLHHAFSLSGRATFSFFPQVDLVRERPGDVPPVDPLPSIWRGILAHPSWDHVRSAISTINGRRLRLVGSIDALGFAPKEQAAASLLRREPATVRELGIRSGLDTRSTELLAYFLVITKLAEIAERVTVHTPEVTVRQATGSLGATLSSGQYVRKMSFAMRAVAPGRHPLRIPSPMPGKLASMQVTPAAPPEDGGDAVVASQALSQAEMHMVLGERDHALAFARKALAIAPRLPEAMAFLAYLEGAALGVEHEELLRDFVKMVDAAIAKDDTCRHAYFYRAALKKRLGDHEGAIRDLRLAVTREPDDDNAQRELRAYEQRVRDGTIVLPGTPHATSLLDRLRAK